MNVAIILAGGVGSRLEMSVPKQFFKVAGKMVMEHTVDVFERNHHIDEIVIVSNPFYISEVENIVIKNGWKKVRKILKGGKERYDSSLAAIRAYEDPDLNLIFHDAVRPLVSDRIINDVVEALATYRAVDVALPSADTIIRVDGEFIEDIPDRSQLRRGQTPQAFRMGTIRKAYELAMKDPDFKVTDDCGVVKKYLPEEKIVIVRGEESNMKLTYKEDTYLLDKFFQLRNMEVQIRTVSSEDFTDKVAVVFGGSYGIGKHIVDLLETKRAKVHSFSRSRNQVDVSKREDIQRALAQVYRQEGKIDFVVNTAGILNKEPLMSMPLETVRNAVEVNYMGTVYVAMEAFPYLKESRGQLLFFTSSSYTRGRAFYSIYSSTKAAIVNFVQAIAQEWDSFGIRVNCINPERTKTPMRIQNFGNEPENTLLSPERVAEVSVQTLLSDYTGQVVNVKIRKENE